MPLCRILVYAITLMQNQKNPSDWDSWPCKMIVGAFITIKPFGHAQHPLANLMGEEIVTIPISNNMKCLH